MLSSLLKDHVLAAGGGAPASCPSFAGNGGATAPPETIDQPAIFSILLSNSGLRIDLLPGGRFASDGGSGADVCFEGNNGAEMLWKGLETCERYDVCIARKICGAEGGRGSLSDSRLERNSS